MINYTELKRTKVREWETRTLTKYLEQHEWDQKQTAGYLNICPTFLHRKLKELGLQERNPKRRKKRVLQ
jgi:DNA-binding NtrC family response regulator